MSRLDDTLRRDLRVIADRATPSPDAWQQILIKAADQEPTQETEIIMLTENTLTTRRWPLVAAAAAIVALLVGALALVNRDRDTQPADDPPTPTVAPEPESAPVSEFPDAGSVLEPGRYTTDTPGVTVTFTLGEGRTAPWTLATNERAGISLVSDESAREFIAIGRIGSWFDADEARDENTTGLGSIAAGDIDGWIEQNGIIVVNSAEVEVGGRSAEYRQFRLDTTPGATADFCPDGEAPCLWAVSGSADVIDESSTPVPVGRDRLHSVWLVDMAEYEPLFVVAIPNLVDEETWFAETVQPIIDSIELGEPAPAVEGGTARITAAADTSPSPFPGEGQTLTSGPYETGAFGVPAIFEIPEAASAPWTVYVNNQEAIVFGHGDSTFVAIKRIGSFFGADEARDPAARGLGSIPPDDIDRWIEENGLILDDSRDVTVGGRTAQFRTVRLPADVGGDACPGGVPPCLHIVSSSADQQAFNRNPTTAMTDLAHSLWIVELDDYEPLGILAYTSDPDHQAWLDELAPFIESIELGDPAPATATGRALLPTRVQVSASYSGTRAVEPLLEDGPREVVTTYTVEGDLAGELTGVGVQETPAEGYDELTFVGTIEGLGTGALTMRQEWTSSLIAGISTTTVVIGGTGDFEGFTGRVITSIDNPDESGEDPIFTGRMTFELVVPHTG